jgi:dTDP-4-amino-4,6-dideoxygalactose transaminase
MRNVPLFKVFMSEDVLKPVCDVLMSGYVGQGIKVDEFEKALQNFLGVPRICTTNSGTSALHLALRLIKSGTWQKRSEILSTPLTCLATNIPIKTNGYKIRWVDLDPNTCNLDLTDLRRKISPNTAAIMVVHWGGYPVDLSELKEIQSECYRLYGYTPPIIEDCAHAFGASYKGVPIGNHGNYCCFSLQAIKHLTTCDGGFLVCPYDSSHKRAELLRWFGLDRKSSQDFRCSQIVTEEDTDKLQMNDLMATIGLHNLPHMKGVIEAHRRNADFLHQKLNGEGIGVPVGGIRLMERKNDRVSADWVFTIRVERRQDFMKMMKAKGIGVSQVHDRNDKHPIFKEFKTPLPITDQVCSDMCAIPCGWWLTQEDREYIVECIKAGW